MNSSSGITPAAKQELIGEAKFVRAFSYFYLVNLFGDVPLILSTNYQVNASLPRTSKVDVYKQITSDLRDAQRLLSTTYLNAALQPTSEKTRPTSWAATALLARTYLYTENWSGADSAATAIITNSQFSLSPLSGTNSVFEKNSSEAIWQLQPVLPGYNTFDGYYFILTAAPTSSRPAALSAQLIQAFEPGDGRFTSWVGSITKNGTTYYYPFKYKIGTYNTSAPVTEYLMVFRLAEQYLIRSEAEAHEGKTSAALADLDVIRGRANLQPYSGATDQTSLLTAIWQEDRIEFCFEWGHRWLDIKRNGSANVVMQSAATQKGSTWNTNAQLYPIPLTDIQNDPNLVQNPGY